MTWMQRLKRVFDIDIEVCERCGGHVKVIAIASQTTKAEDLSKMKFRKSNLPTKVG